MMRSEIPDGRLLCSLHNRYLAERDYGQAAISRHRRLEQDAPA